MRKLIAIALIAGLFGRAQLFAADTAKPNPWQQTLNAVPAPELPARAAELVKNAKARDRRKVTVQVIDAALARNPAAAVAVVGAVARAVPEVAALAAGAAAAAQPAQAADIARAAASSAPAEAGKIVAAVCRAAPQQYREIAARVAQVAPGAKGEILRAVASVFPELKPGIEQALAGGEAAAPPVAIVLDSARPAGPSHLAGSASGAIPSTVAAPPTPGSLPRGPLIAPPYIPLPGGVTNVNPSSSGPVPRGERNYAAP